MLPASVKNVTKNRVFDEQSLLHVNEFSFNGYWTAFTRLDIQAKRRAFLRLTVLGGNPPGSVTAAFRVARSFFRDGVK